MTLNLRSALRLCLAIAGLVPMLGLAQHQHGAANKGDAGKATAKKPGDAKKIADAMSAAPKEISRNATIMDWPEKEGGEPRQLRAGTNEWVCFPSSPSQFGNASIGDPMCLDKQWQGWGNAWMSKTQPKVTGTGIAYMLKGDKGASNTDPFATKPTADNQWVVAPSHVMILYEDLKLLDAYPTDPKSGGPWVMWKGTPYAHLMVPVSPTQAAMVPAPKKK